MKKLISLLIVIIISTVFVGCDLMSIFKQSEVENTTPTTTDTPTTTTTSITTATTREPIVPTFEHGDNLTDEDFYFIMQHLQAEGTGYPRYPRDCSDIVDNYTKRNNQFNSTIYQVKIDLNAPSYFICAYMDTEYYKDDLIKPPTMVEYGLWVNTFVWHKFENANDVPTKIDNYDFALAYAVYNCTMEKDLLNGVDTDFSCKYFVPLLDGYSDLQEDITSKYSLVEYFFLDYSSNIDFGEYVFVPHGTYKKRYTRKKYIRIDNEGNYYLHLMNCNEIDDIQKFDFEIYRDEIGYLYDDILSYLVVLEDIDYPSMYSVYIRLDYYWQQNK